MNCLDFEADLVDLARQGTALAGSEALRAHLSTCGACAERFRRERLLSEGLRALASADAVPDNPEAERWLLDAFRAQPVNSANVARTTSTRWMLAAAASLALLATGWTLARWPAAGPARRPADSTTVRGQIPSSARPDVPAPSVPVAGAAAVVLPPSAAPTTPDRRRAQAAVPAGTARVPTRGAAADIAAAADTAAPDAPQEFVALPAAEALPRLESGVIVRVELPVSSLPAYGLPILPDSVRAPVTADVLVGQDGQPRAIRLVNYERPIRR